MRVRQWWPLVVLVALAAAAATLPDALARPEVGRTPESAPAAAEPLARPRDFRQQLVVLDARQDDEGGREVVFSEELHPRAPGEIRRRQGIWLHAPLTLSGPTLVDGGGEERVGAEEALGRLLRLPDFSPVWLTWAPTSGPKGVLRIDEVVTRRERIRFALLVGVDERGPRPQILVDEATLLHWTGANEAARADGRIPPDDCCFALGAYVRNAERRIDALELTADAVLTGRSGFLGPPDLLRLDIGALKAAGSPPQPLPVWVHLDEGGRVTRVDEAGLGSYLVEGYERAGRLPRR